MAEPKALKLAPTTAALLPPLEEGYNEVHCHKCGKTEDPSVYDDSIAYQLMDHDECFDCFFGEPVAKSDVRELHAPEYTTGLVLVHEALVGDSVDYPTLGMGGADIDAVNPSVENPTNVLIMTVRKPGWAGRYRVTVERCTEDTELKATGTDG